MSVLPDKKKTRFAVITGLSASALGATGINIKKAIDKMRKEEDISKVQKIMNKIENANIPEETKEKLREYIMSFIGNNK